MTAKHILRYLRNVWKIRIQFADEDLIDVAWRELQAEYAGEEFLTWTERNDKARV